MHEHEHMSAATPDYAGDTVDNIFARAIAPSGSSVWDAADRAVSAEIDRMIATARRFPRSMKRFIDKARDSALCSRSVAESCYYTLRRSGKTISGPSIRLAEIVFSAYGNLRVHARLVDVGDEFLTMEGTAIDLESNAGVSKPVTRRIVDSKGKRYGVDMIGTTQQAAASIAIRNAIFVVVPRALVDEIVDQCRATAGGKGENLEDRRSKAVAYWTKLGVSETEMCSFVGVPGLADLGFEHLADLVGLANAIKQGDTSVEAERERVRQEREDAEYSEATANDVPPSIVPEDGGRKGRKKAE
jgi:hypothetical protein